MHCCKWEKMCFPKSLGGLNFRDVEGFNQALIAKKVWRIVVNPKSLVSRFLKGIYFSNSDILLAEEGENPSYLWKSLIWGRDLLRKGLRYRVGNDNSISFFQDPWIPREMNFKPICIKKESILLSHALFVLTIVNPLTIFYSDVFVPGRFGIKSLNKYFWRKISMIVLLING